MSAGNPENYGGATPNQVSLEYTRGSGSFFPPFTTSAVNSGLQNAVQTVNGETVDGITIEANNTVAGHATVTITQPEPGAIAIAVAGTGPITVPIVTSFPSSPLVGLLVFRSDTSKLELYNGTTWVGVALT